MGDYLVHSSPEISATLANFCRSRSVPRLFISNVRINMANVMRLPIEHADSLIQTPSVTKFHKTYDTKACNKYFLDYPAKWLLLRSWIASVSETDVLCAQHIFLRYFLSCRVALLFSIKKLCSQKFKNLIIRRNEI